MEAADVYEPSTGKVQGIGRDLKEKSAGLWVYIRKKSGMSGNASFGSSEGIVVRDEEPGRRTCAGGDHGLSDCGVSADGMAQFESRVSGDYDG